MTESFDDHQIMVALCSLGPKTQCSLELNYSEASVLLATAYRIRFILQRNLAMNARLNRGETLEVPAEIIEYDQFLSEAIAQVSVNGFSYLIKQVNSAGSAVINQTSKVVEVQVNEHPRIAWFLAVGLLDNLLDREDSLAENPYSTHWRSDMETLRDISVNLSRLILKNSGISNHDLLMQAWERRRQAWQERLTLDGLLNGGT